MTTRVLWCLAAGWGAVALLRLASAPRPVNGAKSKPRPAPEAVEPPSEDSEPIPAS
jgi:hypothetical protein